MPRSPSYSSAEIIDRIYPQKLSRKDVAVSKLCCPACWEHFLVLRTVLGEEEYYKLRGRHSTVYPVQLPIWTNPTIVLELNRRFSLHLRRELEILRDKHNETTSESGHRHTPSTESALSGITNSSEVSTSTNVDFLDKVKRFTVRAGLAWEYYEPEAHASD
jgi:hypothetical protein